MMSSLYVLLIATVAWLVWVPAAAAQKAARGEAGGISVFPAIPLFPLLAWGAAWALGFIRPWLGVYVVGGVHVLLLAALLLSLVKSSLALRSKRA